MGATTLQLFPDITYEAREFLTESKPGIFHSIYDIQNFYFTNRLDLFAVVDPGVKALFFDVGMDALCGTRMLDAIVEQNDLTWDNVEVVVSHFHDDHDDNLAYCISKGLTTAFHGPHIPFSPERSDVFLLRSGALHEQDEAIRPYVNFLINEGRFTPEVAACLQPIEEGHVFQVGDYELEVIYTPGHTPEHISLVDRKNKLLFAGDHILDSAPGLMQFDPDLHLLGRFFESLRDIRAMELETIYMSHHDTLHDVDAIKAFIDAIVARYDKPLSKVTALLEAEGDELTAYDVARRYYSYLPNGGLEGQPDHLRVRRIAIILGYLEYLAEEGVLVRTLSSDGRFWYRKA